MHAAGGRTSTRLHARPRANAAPHAPPPACRPPPPRVARQPAPQRCRLLRTSAGKGFGKAPEVPAGGGGGGGTSSQEAIKRARDTQLSAAELLAEFMRAPDLRAAVSARVASLDEAFFAHASTYVALARRDGVPDVVAQLEEVYRVAVSVKEATLRPEIRLLNALLRAESEAQRAPLYAQQAPALVSDGEYFFALVERMTRDVEAQPGGPLNARRDSTLAALRAIAREARKATRQTPACK